MASRRKQFSRASEEVLLFPRTEVRRLRSAEHGACTLTTSGTDSGCRRMYRSQGEAWRHWTSAFFRIVCWIRFSESKMLALTSGSILLAECAALENLNSW